MEYSKIVKIPSYCAECKSPLKLEEKIYLIDEKEFKVLAGERTCNCPPKTRVEFDLILK
jgi:hypothetical protein